MSEFTSEALSIMLSVMAFGLMLVIVLWFIPEFTDIMINVVETSVL